MVKLIYSFLPLGNNLFLNGGLGVGEIGLLSTFGDIILIIDNIKLRIIDTNLFNAMRSRNFIFHHQVKLCVPLVIYTTK